MNLREDRFALFSQLADPATMPRFFDRVADDVSWTVEGVHPLGGVFTSKSDFVGATFDRLAPLMRTAIRLQLHRVFIDGDTVVAELEAAATTREGGRYDNHLCWVCRFSGTSVGDQIVEVRAYLDSAMIAWTVARNETTESADHAIG